MTRKPSLLEVLGNTLADQIDPEKGDINTMLRPLEFYGDNKNLFNHKRGEVILSGPADTGKTMAALQYLNLLCLTYPNLQAAMLRQTYKSIASSCFETFNRKIVIPGTVIVRGGDLRPEQIQYKKTGSIIWVGGMDNPDKVLSSERDVVYINQAEELSLAAYEYITTRANGRAGNMPGFLIFGDCNPGPPTHWIRGRAKSGRMKLLVSTHRDNPTIYDPITGKLTEEGKERLAPLEGLSGARKDRLFHGKWVQPEGAIFDVFRGDLTEPGSHVVKRFEIPSHWPRMVGVDPVGAFTAAVWLAYDPINGVLYLYREYFEPFGLTTPDHVQALLRLSQGETIFLWAGGGPSENQQRLDFDSYGLPLNRAETVDVWSQIDRVYQLLKDGALYIFEDCLGIISELGEYRREIRKDGTVTEKIANKEQFHLIDALRYIITKLTETVGDEKRIVQVQNKIGRDY